ncbi:MAG: OprD family outer membrane porin [Candidatus Thiodiazotropha endolucinida]
MEKTRLTTFGAERVPAGISFVERKRVFDQLFRVVGTQNRVTQPVRCHRNTFLPDSERSLPKRMVQTGLLSGVLFGLSGVATVQAEEGVFGNFRLGVIHAEDETGNETDGSAIGGKLGYISPTWKGLSTGATFYTTGELFDDENGDFFSSENASYAILGEAYIQAEYSNTALRVGRFELDTPHADTDDIRMVPNTFQGLLLSNNDITGTTLYLTYLDKWAGVDADIPERFRELNGDDGLTAVGAVFEGIEQLTLQGWYYQGSNFAELFYLEGMYETDAFSIGLQIGSQSDDTGGESGPDGDVWGITGSYTLADFTITAAYNDVSGRVTNGFGGGPYFTSADDHAIDGVEDQEATAVGIEYAGIEALAVGVLHVDFDQGANETDYYAVYDLNDHLGLELIYTDMHEDGDFVRLMANYGF